MDFQRNPPQGLPPISRRFGERLPILTTIQQEAVEFSRCVVLTCPPLVPRSLAVGSSQRSEAGKVLAWALACR
jgi:hypothetical protein